MLTVLMMYSDRSRTMLSLLSNFINKTAFTVSRSPTIGNRLFIYTPFETVSFFLKAHVLYDIASKKASEIGRASCRERV